MASKSNSFSIVLPVYNEAKAIRNVVRKYCDLSSKLINSELIIAEDGSTDGTKEILNELGKEYSFKLIVGKERKGYNRAVIDALKLAKNNIILFSDGGGGQNPDDFPKLVQYVGDYDIVSGHKKPRRDPFSRIVYSKIYNLYISLIFLHWFNDIDSGFKAYKKEVLDRILPQCKTFKECISTEILLRSLAAGYKIKEVPVKHFVRGTGEVKTFKLSRLPKIVYSLVFSVLKLKLELL